MASEPTFRVYNTLTNSTEAITPIEPGHFKFYSCGPTVYSFAHIGNFRSFLTADLILRIAEAIGWQVTYVSNITDVGHLTEDDVADASGEDKMAKALKSKEGEAFRNVWDLARHYANALLDDWNTLNLRPPTVRPRAAEHMRQQILAIEDLMAKGHAYETSQGIYFAVDTVSDYGKLSGNREAHELNEAVRDVVVDSEKRSPRDFALWKKDDKHLMQWYSPWGWGFPGWHLECSVMAMEYLGPTQDVHAGGEDLIFPHHECEIAQSECLTGEQFANTWVHTRFLQVEGEKMSKSKGNFFTVRDLVLPESEGGRGIDPLALRLTLLSGHYRKPFNFTFKTLKTNARHVERFRETLAMIDEAVASDAPGDDLLGERLEGAYNRVLNALLDDLNTPAAIAGVIGGTKMIQAFAAKMNGASARSARAWFDRINALLGIIEHETALPQASADEGEDPLAEQVEALIAERNAARAAKDWSQADALRDAITALGVEIRDTPDGTTWKRV